MRALVLAGVTGLAALAAAAAAGAGTIRAAGAVRALAVSGVETIFAADLGRGCEEVRVYDNADHGVRRYAKHCWERTSTGSGVAAVAVADGRALWLTYTGGNVRDWTLWTRTRTTAPRRIRTVSRDVDGPAPIMIGTANEATLLYSVDDTLFAVGSTGARLMSWRAPARIVASSAQGWSYAALLENGDVAEIDGDGRLIRINDFAPREVRAAVGVKGGVLVQKAAAFELRIGSNVQSFPIAPGARLVGYFPSVLAYATPTELRLLRTRDGRDVLYKKLPRGFVAGFDRRGAAWATGRTVAFRVALDVYSALSP